jgi:arylsulfatase
MVADETFDVGVDTRTPVNEQDYQVPFGFDGKHGAVRTHGGKPIRTLR